MSEAPSRSILRRLASATLGLALAFGPVQAGTITLNGVVDGDPLPKGYEIEEKILAVKDGIYTIEVTGKGDCDTEVADSGTPRKTCIHKTAIYKLPEGHLAVKPRRKVHYVGGGKNIYIGDLTGITRIFKGKLEEITWVRLRGSHSLEATVSTASLVVVDASTPPTDNQTIDAVKKKDDDPAGDLKTTDR